MLAAAIPGDGLAEQIFVGVTLYFFHLASCFPPFVFSSPPSLFCVEPTVVMLRACVRECVRECVCVCVRLLHLQIHAHIRTHTHTHT
jgi:hypothetical protein